MFAEIALNVPLFSFFTYQIPEGSKLREGCRVEIRFGSRKMTGVAVSISESLPPSCPVGIEKVKYIERILDDEPLLTPELMEIGRWMSGYYICPPGEIYSAMIPSGRRESEFPSSLGSGDFSAERKPLSPEQAAAVEAIIADNGKADSGLNAHYVYGMTGSGKTEVFLAAAERILERGRGVIYLVPEIALAPQVTQDVAARFGNTVAVLHSGLTPSQRLAEWRRILRREARVVIGARSAVFAPVPDLGLVVIDEEHDGSYKSGSSPRYHARQVAMRRCSALDIPLVMGSATPSAEAFYAMKSGSFARHVLGRRLSGGAMPEIRQVDLGKIPPDSGCISPELAREIRATLASKRQAILFLNRRGFTHFFRCNLCGFEMKCRNCSVALTYHKAQGRLRCHYCGWSTEPPSSCPQCGSLDVGYAGFGTEFIESEVAAKFPSARVVRLDADSVGKKGELEEKIEAFRKGEFDIMLGTQMVAKGLNFPSLQLVGVVSADTGLHMPDFRAAERTFALITQVAGRAGRFFPDGKVLVQSFSPGQPPIAMACAGLSKEFYEAELEQRKVLGFPPFSRLIRIVFRASDMASAEAAAESGASLVRGFAAGFAEKNPSDRVEVLGPSECPLSMVSGSFRQQILVRGQNMRALNAVCAPLIRDYRAPSGVYVEVDVDPVSMM